MRVPELSFAIKRAPFDCITSRLHITERPIYSLAVMSEKKKKYRSMYVQRYKKLTKLSFNESMHFQTSAKT